MSAAELAAAVDLTEDADGDFVAAADSASVEEDEPPSKRAKLEPEADSTAAAEGAISTAAAEEAGNSTAAAAEGANSTALTIGDFAAIGAKLLVQFPYKGHQWNAAIREDGYNWNANNEPKTSTREGSIAAGTKCAAKNCPARKLMRLTKDGWQFKSCFANHSCVKPTKQRAPIIAVTPATKQEALLKFTHGQTKQQVYETMMADAMKSADPEAALAKVPKPQQLKYLRDTVKLGDMRESDLMAITQEYGPQSKKNSIKYFNFIDTNVVGNAKDAPAVSAFNPKFLMVTPRMLERLRSNPTGVVYIDGTFDIVANGLQVCTLAINVKGYAIGCAFLVSSGRDTATYINLLSHLRQSTGNTWNPKAVVTDFELALQNAALTVFPETQIWSCYFHFCQAVRKFCVQHATQLSAKQDDIESLAKRVFLAPTVPLHNEEVAKLTKLAGATFNKYFQRTFLE
jgi:hypothetical protein